MAAVDLTDWNCVTFYCTQLSLSPCIHASIIARFDFVLSILRVLAHSNARALLIDPIELPNHGVVACGLGLKNTRTQSRL